jgi:alpha-D-xyloside xylohydrolase
LVRAFGLQFPELGAHPEDQYCLGDELLVAPVETKGLISRALIKPPGRWFDFEDGSELQGADGAAVMVNAPLTKLPLFIAEGALVPMLEPTMDTLAPTTDSSVRSFANSPGVLWVRVQPGATARTHTLFDGTKLESSGGALKATAGTSFTTSVVWEFVGVTTGTVTHGGTPLSAVTDLDVVASGVLISGSRTLIKTPLDGQPTVWR